jgi:O-antigen/teichoic acid export membrane protein
MIARLKAAIDGIARRKLARDTAVMSLGYIGRLILQAVYFIVIARTLGATAYGGFVAIVAMAGVLTPFTGNGCPSLLLKNVSRDRSALGVYWGNGLLMMVGSGLLFTLLLVSCGPLISGIKMRLAILCIALSELVLARITELASFAWTALGRMRDTALLNIYISLSRLLAVVALALITRHPTVQDWAIAVLLGSVACSIFSAWGITRIARPSFDLKLVRTGLGEGAYFAVGSAAATFYNDIDKTMLARMADLTSTGIYGAAYRLIDVSMAPIKAMTSSTFAEAFRRGAKGISSAEEYAHQLIKRATWIGLALTITLLVGAPLLPHIVGRSFSRSVEALRWLALLPLLRSGHYFLGDALSAAGLNGTRATIQVVVALINIGLNIYFIRHWSWRGAAWTSLMCDGLLVLGFGAAVRYFSWRSRNAPSNLTLTMESGLN